MLNIFASAEHEWETLARAACTNMLNGMISEVIDLLQADPEEYFIYKHPQVPISTIDPLHLDKMTSDQFGENQQPSYLYENRIREMDWCCIKNVRQSELVRQVQEFIGLWLLTPATKYTVLPKERVEFSDLGTRYFLDALFSKPTPICPNPLAVAKVHFYLTVSSIMPDNFPIMTCYRFEGFKTIYYALGDKALKSLEFQRFYIDSILHKKLSFYTEIWDCLQPDDHDLGTSANPSLSEIKSKSYTRVPSNASLMTTASKKLSSDEESIL